MRQIDGIEGPTGKGAHDSEGHRGSGDGPEAIRESFVEMSPAAPSRPIGFGDYGGKNQSLHRDK